MVKKKSISKLSDKDEGYFAGKAIKERHLAVDGKPDDRDYNNLLELFKLYDKHTAGALTRMLKDLQVERALNHTGRGQVSMDKAGSFCIAFPRDLQLFLETYYPTLFKNKEHARWFLKKFPQFRR